MRLIYNPGWPERITTELVVELWEYAEDNPVYRMLVAGEEDVYFEVAGDADSLDVIDAAFAARREVRGG